MNVGLELVADPSVLFLDEPTSGLDSTASKLVIQVRGCCMKTGWFPVLYICMAAY